MPDHIHTPCGSSNSQAPVAEDATGEIRQAPRHRESLKGSHSRLNYPEHLFFSRQDEGELPNLGRDNVALQQECGSRN
jgi:hypothetical protein